MPLKPGQKKEIKIKVEKIKGLQAALQKAREYEDAMNRYSTITPGMSNSIKTKINTLKTEIQKEYKALKAEVDAIKKNAAKSKTGPNKQLDALVKTMAKECSQILPLYKKTKKILLRGSQGGQNAYVGRSWQNRKTKDSDHKLQAWFDLYLKSQGFKALRSNSIFTTTDYDQAVEYGEVYYIYPKNGFAFHWYENETDLVIDNAEQVFSTDKMETMLDAASDWYEKKYKKESPDALYQFDDYENPAKLITLLQKYKYPKAAKLKPESFIDGPGIRYEIGPTQKNLPAALKRGGEVCIAGEYYAIRQGTKLAQYINKALGIKSEWDDDEYNNEWDDGYSNPVDDADDGYDDL